MSFQAKEVENAIRGHLTYKIYSCLLNTTVSLMLTVQVIETRKNFDFVEFEIEIDQVLICNC